MNVEDRLIVALDAPSLEDAERMAARLTGKVRAFKVGKELFTACGPEAVRAIRRSGGRVFLDLKFHDIPNTVAGACRSAAKLGAFMMNVHASGGSAMISKAAQAVAEATRGADRPILLAVTVLTSMGPKDLEEIGIQRSPAEQVTSLARLAKAAGADGVVASGEEIEAIRKACGPDFKIVTPGIRPAWSETGDQKRIVTPADAIRRGADYLVVGRPITAAADPAEAASRVLDEMRGAPKT